MKTLYCELADKIWNQAAATRILFCDVDGVFSDGRIYMGNSGEELKAFHTKDGFGIKALIASGVEVAIITGRRSQLLENRMQSLGVKHLIQGCEDKITAMDELLSSLGLTREQAAFVGDDVPDLECIKAVGLGIGVADAHPLVAQHADWITTVRGGFGAVREITDTIMQAQDTLSEAKGASI